MKELKKTLFLIFGIFFFILGIAGVLLPIIPGIPFFLVSIVFFAKSSRKFLKGMLNNRYIGKYFRKIRKEGLSNKTKVSTLSVIWLTHITSIIFIKILVIKIVLFSSLIITTVVIMSIEGKDEKR